jgi:hypothetical protein
MKLTRHHVRDHYPAAFSVNNEFFLNHIFVFITQLVIVASLEDHNERFTRNDLKNLREWSVKN